MTENQYLSRQEQIEAARAEFNLYWNRCLSLMPEWNEMPLPLRVGIEQMCWAYFKLGKGLLVQKADPWTGRPSQEPDGP